MCAASMALLDINREGKFLLRNKGVSLGGGWPSSKSKSPLETPGKKEKVSPEIPFSTLKTCGSRAAAFPVTIRHREDSIPTTDPFLSAPWSPHPALCDTAVSESLGMQRGGAGLFKVSPSPATLELLPRTAATSGTCYGHPSSSLSISCLLCLHHRGRGWSSGGCPSACSPGFHLRGKVRGGWHGTDRLHSNTATLARGSMRFHSSFCYPAYF